MWCTSHSKWAMIMLIMRVDIINHIKAPYCHALYIGGKPFANWYLHHCVLEANHLIIAIFNTVYLVEANNLIIQFVSLYIGGRLFDNFYIYIIVYHGARQFNNCYVHHCILVPNYLIIAICITVYWSQTIW